MKACSLTQDFENFASRDQTYVGENGHTLRNAYMIYNWIILIFAYSIKVM